MSTQPRKKKGSVVFGMALEDVLVAYSQEPSSLPYPVGEITSFLKRYGLGCEYIFMKSGPDVTVQLLKKLYNSHGTAPLEKYTQSVHCIAWLLRLFLTELPEPLLTHKFGSSFMKTQANPDLTARYRNMKKLLNALPTVNRAVIRSVLELFRLVLHHRRKNKLTVSGFCSDMGPILLGVDKNGNTSDTVAAADVLKTLITQFQFMIGTADEPAEYDSLPLYTKKSQRVLLTSNSRARGLIAKKRTHSPISSNGSGGPIVTSNGGLVGSMASLPGSGPVSLHSSNISMHNSNGSLVDSGEMPIVYPNSRSTSPPPRLDDEEELVSLTDGIMLKFLDQSVRTVLFESQVRISFNYEAKIPNHLKRNYTLDKLTEIHRGSVSQESRQGAWRPTLEEDMSYAGSNVRNRRDTTTGPSRAGPNDAEDGPTSTARHRRNTASGTRDAQLEGRRSGDESTFSGAHGTHRDKDKDDGAGGGEGDSSGGSAGSRRRSRRISVQDDTSEDHLQQLVRRTSEDLASMSEDLAQQKFRRKSADNLQDALEFSSDDGSDSDPEAHSTSKDATHSTAVNAKDGTAKKRKKLHAEQRRSSTSKATSGARSRLKDSSGASSSSTKEVTRRHRPTQSAEINPDDLDREMTLAKAESAQASSSAANPPASSSSSTNSHVRKRSASSAAPMSAQPASSKDTTASNTSGPAGGNASAAATSQSTGVDSASESAKPRTKGPRPKSKPQHMILDSKMIMEMAPSPPSTAAPPLVITTPPSAPYSPPVDISQ